MTCLIELLEIDLVNYLTVCKQMSLIELLLLHSNTWKYLTVFRQMINSK